ncbi:Glutamyl-tRNA(Gln) amidotransferase subunit A, mitochondrial [Cyphellophora attinorum]|uniref:Glutamyl-tRNA(Gln) amidotransferase subunit A, mitochondrial n=1 Tax=Cyphellophora attinorum TaxID=1664694 RepID=A0A0N1P1M3_9EURO|nr:Glutamyl-tRNA(Gln) amidotransferase subunit A, mitochondrial [Phialophora attinorum]KPI44023.1 Glutamyl-tRNA(Gln) amidotransferase subunit A, mitochondrial [Phialophora attinorum]
MPRVFKGFRDPRALTRLAYDVHVQSARLALGSHDHSNIFIARPDPAETQRLKEWASAAKGRHWREWKDGKQLPISPNDGFTVAVKDNIVTTHLPTSSASDILRGYVPPTKATVVRLMEEAGIAVVGKTNMDEFGMGSHTLHSAFGPMSQPYSKLSVGGSSGGSALAVAAEHCHMALGTDTGGSVRLPAAYLGLFGFKPSYGRISRYGVVPYANSLDTVGILTKNPLDMQLLFRVLDRPDPNDPTCLTAATRDRIATRRAQFLAKRRQNIVRTVSVNKYFERSLQRSDLLYRGRGPFKPTRFTYHRSRRRRRIGVPKDYNIAEMQPEVRTAWRNTITLLIKLGHEVVPVDLPTTQHALSAYYILAPAEASSNLAKYDGVRYGPVRTPDSADADDGVLYSAHRGELFGEEVKRRILLGAFSLSAGAIDNYFLQAQKVRRLVQDDFNRVFRMDHPLLEEETGVENGVDYLLCPTAPTTPPSLEELQKETDPVETYMNDVFTVPASLAGLPAYSFPAPPAAGKKMEDESRSVGMQIIGQYGDDFAVMQFVKSSIWARVEWGLDGAVRPLTNAPKVA